jgi:outer membrane protein assembly factor BamE (lipoprotein component of BamABCDE complex)
MLRRFLTLLLVAGLAGCAHQVGRDFPAGGIAGLELGESSRADVEAALGKPLTTQAWTAKKDFAKTELAQPVFVEQLNYFYAERNGEQAPVEQDVRGQRGVYALIGNGKLVGYSLNSSFARDTTRFPLEQASNLHKGMSEAEVRALFGAPSGQMLYPLSSKPGGYCWTYEFNFLRLSTNTDETASLLVDFGPDRRVVDYSVSNEARKRPTAPATVPIVVPIVVPRR